MSKLLRGAFLFLALIVTGPTAGGAEPPAPEGLETLWADLGTDDPVKAQQAIAALVAQAAQTVPFLKERLQPVPRPDPTRLTRLIADLDNARFAARESATRELKRLGELAEPALRKALAERPSPEARRRMEQVLETHKGRRFKPPPGQRRQARAVEVLELIGDPSARRLLEALAGGAPAAPLTRDARGALERLK
jgi:hypothetical protein